MVPFPRAGLGDGVVKLRLPRERDAGWIAESVSDPEIPRWTRVPSPYTKDHAHAWVALAESMAREGSAYHLLVVGSADDARLGSVGLEVHDPRGVSDSHLHGEVGYWVAAPARGRGVATRAVRLLVAWALERLSLPVIEIHVLPPNAPSHAVARKAGFERVGQRLMLFRGRVEDFDIYALATRNAAGAAVEGRPGA
jgi:RimJ/RimL family protein N-acetyltransferase